MTHPSKSLVSYRLKRAYETFDDAQILANNAKWNSTINRLYYAAYYAVSALLIDGNHKPTTHNGVKSRFSEFYIKTNVIPKRFGRMYSQLFT